MSRGLFTSLYLAGQPFALIDTRERRDHVNGHWFGSTNVPLSALSQRIPRLVPDRRFPIHLLDWGDAPSRTAADLLARLGYDNVIRCPTQTPKVYGDGYVKGQYVWSKAFGEVVAHACGLPEVTPEAYLADYSDAMLFDVRPTAEYKEFTIPGSESLPNSLLLSSTAKLQASGRSALLHCAGRTRSIIGACTLYAAGYEGPFAIFKGGTQAWQLDGHEREFGAGRVFAEETGDTATAQEFLRKWHIRFASVSHSDLPEYIEKQNGSHLFDVSDDAAKGVSVEHGVIRISGTNLIQQTDRSIARYHVPVVLLDQGSGSRAAFCGFWLSKMGFDVSVVFLDSPLAEAREADQAPTQSDGRRRVWQPEELLRHRDAGQPVFDFRTAREFGKSHLKGAAWHNITALVSGNPAPTAIPVAIVGETKANCFETAAILENLGWQIAGISNWNATAFDPDEVSGGTVDDPADESNLFAGRHHGNMQDSQDYLAWEEELPKEIDQEIRKFWDQSLRAVFADN